MEELTVSVLSSQDTWFGVLVDNENNLVASTFSRQRNPSERLARMAENVSGSRPRIVTHPYSRMMSQIFDGKGIDKQVTYNPVLATPYQMKVYQVLKRVPKGRVTTYGSIATAIHSGPRAVGTAVASNPWSLFVPCHRVIPSDLSVGNYSMNQRPDKEGCRTKEELLRREGVLFRDNKILAPSLWIPR
jgi:methylated-DNA-[protein]-cysteine S-methyltransferase